MSPAPHLIVPRPQLIDFVLQSPLIILHILVCIGPSLRSIYICFQILYVLLQFLRIIVIKQSSLTLKFPKLIPQLIVLEMSLKKAFLKVLESILEIFTFVQGSRGSIVVPLLLKLLNSQNENLILLDLFTEPPGQLLILPF